MLSDTEGCLYRDRLDILGLLSLEPRRPTDNVTEVYKIKRGIYRIYMVNCLCKAVGGTRLK